MINIFTKLIYVIFCVITTLILSFFLVIGKLQDDKGNPIPTNKDNCIKYGYKWYEEDKSCDLRIRDK